MCTQFDKFSIRILPRSEMMKYHGAEATAKVAAFINGRDLTGADGPTPQHLLPPYGPAPVRDIVHHLWAATPETRLVPLVAGLAATRVEDVDTWLAITQTMEGVYWEIEPRTGPKEGYLFEKTSYEAELWASIQDLSWEDDSDRTIRLVRERCDHTWLKSQGLTWKRGQMTTDGQVSLFFSVSAGQVTEFHIDGIRDADPRDRAQLIMSGLYDWIRRNCPDPRMRDGAEDPGSLDNTLVYPFTTPERR